MAERLQILCCSFLLFLTILLVNSDANSQVSIPFANQQPEWIFPLYFEDYNGDKDTLYFAYDPTATDVMSYPPDTFDLRFGEGFILRDTSKFTAGFLGIGDSISKVIAATGITGSIIELHKVRFPFTIKWLDTLFYDSIPPNPNLYPYPSLMAELWCGNFPPYFNCPNNFPLCIVAEDPLFYCNGAMPNIMDSMFFDGDTNFVGIYGFDFRIVPYEGWIGLDEFFAIGELNSLQVFPNPFSSKVEVRFEHSNNYDLKIVDVLGRETWNLGTFNNEENRIDVSFLPEGIYFLQVYYENKSYFTKIIKISDE